MASSTESVKTSISEWIDALREEVQWDEKRRLKTAKKLREHLKNRALAAVSNDTGGLDEVIRKSPSMRLSYMRRLEDEGFIGVQG